MMPQTIRRTATLLLLLMLLSLLTACQTGSPEGTTAGSAPGEASPETDPPTELTLFENGHTDYTLIMADGIGNAERGLALQLVYSLTSYSTEGGLPYAKGAEQPAAPYEILFGRTDRPESIAVYEELDASPNGGFAVRVIGTKLVFAGTSNEMLERAYSHFAIRYLITNASTTLRIPATEHTVVLETAELSSEAEPLQSTEPEATPETSGA